MNDCIYVRFNHNVTLWHTYTKSIIIAINPFQKFPRQYDRNMMEQFKGEHRLAN